VCVRGADPKRVEGGCAFKGSKILSCPCLRVKGLGDSRAEQLAFHVTMCVCIHGYMVKSLPSVCVYATQKSGPWKRATGLSLEVLILIECRIIRV
jgi:hypothetical protein